MEQEKSINKKGHRHKTAAKKAHKPLRKVSSSRKSNYLTKRILVSAAASGFAEAAERTII